jgi:hypothetical protein
VTPFAQRVERTDEGLIRLSLSDNAVSLIVFAMEFTHPNNLDEVLASLSSGVIRDELRAYVVEATEALNIPATDGIIESVLDDEMGRLEAFVKHGSEKGPLLPIERDDVGISVVITPDVFFVLTISCGVLIEQFFGKSEAFFIEMNDASSILSDVEKVAIMALGRKDEYIN